ncbi:MAG: hypothetical protein FWC23_05815 [Chitinispirillia bacterium]|nr:hypothetical protein [Chitinispirillia bacterium]MCL2268684.1 hypothetical protein [Chitinispirillia bacterium]
MSFWKKSLAVACAVVVVLGSSVMAEPADAGAIHQAEAVENEVEMEAEYEAAPEPEPLSAARHEPHQPAAAQAPAPVVVSVPEKSAAKLDVKPYGAVQYRLRLNQTSLTNQFIPEGAAAPTEETFGALDYSNRLCWRAGLRVNYDDQFSMQFQLGNDWGAAENVTWAANNSPRARVGYQNLYVHLAYFKWNPGYMFAEAGVVPLNSNGTLDLLESSITRTSAAGRYGEAAFNTWGDVNNSMIGLKLGVPVIKEGAVKLGVELFQTVLDARTQVINAQTTGDPDPNPASVLMVLALPVDAGAFKVTPEVSAVLNRNIRVVDDKGQADHEILAGLAGSYKVNGAVSLTFKGGIGSLSNGGTKVDGEPDVSDFGVLAGIGGTIKAGPGTIQIAVDYNSTENRAELAGTETTASYDYIYTDLRYAMKMHERVTLTPRYRTYTTNFPDGRADKSRFVNRFELIIEGSF